MAFNVRKLLGEMLSDIFRSGICNISFFIFLKKKEMQTATEWVLKLKL